MLTLDTQLILVVDDEMDNLKIFQATMELLYNATVRIVSSAEEALSCLESFHPTLIVTDLSMPKIDGYELLHRLRQRTDAVDLPIVALTAHAMAGDRERILAAGFDGYISKPFEVTRLGDNLLTCLKDYAVKHPKPVDEVSRLDHPKPTDETSRLDHAKPTDEASRLDKSLQTVEADPVIHLPS
jgi:CheY-like chemotaxis protein